MKGWLVIAMAAWALATGASAEPADGELGTVTVVATGLSNMTAASAGDVSHADLTAVPLLRPAAILENIPGLIVTQHSGEGKANQYFLRAFNLDHGTDLALEVDDMPVNLPTQAHGQGYSDLNFLIPELAADLHYKKGPYFADEGDFATAGTARIELVNEMPASVTAGVGEDGYRRLLVAGSTRLAAGSLLGAVELYENDGPFQVPDAYRRRSGILRYHEGDPSDFTSVTAMTYAGRWHSTDQVPLRAIEEGLIGRYGSLNPTDGGDTRRDSLSVTRVRRSDSGLVQFSAYAIRYRLDLWSMFTYFLADPGHGDQMLQHDERIVYGFKASKTWYASLAGRPLTSVVGIQTRLDDIRDVGISPTDARAVVGVRQDAQVRETMGAIYAESRVEWTDNVSTTLGLREDAFSFVVHDRLVDGAGRCTLASDPLGCNTGSVRASITSPKFGLTLGPWAHSTFFLTAGDGYHSNDARGVTRDAQSPGGAAVTPLTRATSAEVGFVSRPAAGWETHVDVFRLRLKSELVFDGDAGSTSPSGSTTRTGFEWGNRYVINEWLAANVNAAVTKARFDSPAPPDDLGCGNADRGHPCAPLPAVVGRYVPNSPTSVIDAAVTAGRETGWFGAIRLRHFGQSPLVEDGSARSPGYTTLDLQLGLRSTDRWLVALDMFNVTNTRWNDIEYYYASRLQGENLARPDFVVHPGVPRTLRLSVHYQLAP